MVPLSRRRRVTAIAGGAAAAAVILLVLSFVPVSRSFAFSSEVLGPYFPQCSGLQIPRGAVVAFHWVAPTAVSVFEVWNCATGTGVYVIDASQNGSGSFVSAGGTYAFGAGCLLGVQPLECIPANVTGSYTSPLLVWP